MVSRYDRKAPVLAEGSLPGTSTRIRVSLDEIWYMRIGEGVARITCPWLGKGSWTSFMTKLVTEEP
jgi:hypothetical protein